MNAYPGPAGGKSQIEDYSLSGVMRYLQSEWQHNEGDRIQWELERANMKIKIAQLEGENRGLKFLAEHHAKRVADLKKEVISKRGSISLDDEIPEETNQIEKPLEKSPVSEDKDTPYDNSAITTELASIIEAREYLQRCLEEVSYLLQETEYSNAECEPPMFNDDGSSLNSEYSQPSETGSNLQVSDSPIRNPYANPYTEPKSEPRSDDDDKDRQQTSTALGSTGVNEDHTKAPFSPPMSSSSPSSPSSRVPTKITRATRAGSLNSGSTRSPSSESVLSRKSVINHNFNKDFTLAGHLDIVRAVEYGSNPYELFTASDDGVIKLWDLTKTKKYETYSSNTYRGHHGIITSLVYSEKLGRLYSGGQDATIRVWDPTKTLDIRTLGAVDGGGHSETVWDLSLCDSKGLFASASADGSVKIWSMENKLLSTIEPIKTHHSTTRTKVLGVEFYDPQFPSSLLSSMEVPVSAITLCFVEKGSKVVVGYQDSSIEVYDVGTGQLVTTLHKSTNTTQEDSLIDNIITSLPNQVNKVAYSPKDSIVFSAFEDGFIRYHDIRSGHTVHEENHAHLGPVNSVSAAPGGGAFVSGGGNQASMKIWSVSERMVVAEFRDHDSKSADSITDVEWCKRLSSDGINVNTIASCGGDSKINVYK